MESKVTIIIPVYNVIRYIEKCFLSVAEQTYGNIEVIVVDDGSTDGSEQFCDDFALRDSRFRVVHQMNRGVSSARNVGIEMATGDFVCIIDSDDYLDSHYVEYMVERMIREDLDLVICGVYALEDNNGNCQFIKQSTNEHLLNKIETLEKLFSSDGFNGWGVNKLYRLSILNRHSVRFREDLRYCEDEVFCLEYCIYVDRAVYIKDILYHYMLNDGSVNHQMYKEKRFDYNALDRLRADDICASIISQFPEAKTLQHIFLARRFRSNMATMDKFYRNYNGDKDTYKMLRGMLRRYWGGYFKYEKTSAKRKIGATILAVSPKLYYVIAYYRKK